MKTSLSKYQIRLNLIDLVVEYVKDLYPEPSPDEGQKEFLQLLGIYRTDTVRKMNRQAGDLDYLFDNLKVGVRLAASLIEQVLTNERESLKGWYWGAKPKNMVQHIYSLLCSTAYELSLSIQEIESHYPDLACAFALERQLHAASVEAEEVRQIE
jgi:hypothetical protein